MDADAIVVLDRGVVAEIGTHAQLLQTAGLYADMWQRQVQDNGSSSINFDSMT